MPTVMQLIRDVLPPGTRMVAGEDGLYSEVSWMVSLRPTPPGFDTLRGNELALAGPGVAEGLGVTLSHLVLVLAERGVSAIAVIGEADAEACRIARSRNIAIISLPAQTDRLSLESAVAGYINEERQYIYQKEREINQALMEIAVAGGGSAAILGKLKELTGRKIGFIDSNFKPLVPVDDALASIISGAVQKALPHLREGMTSVNAPVIGMSLNSDLSCFWGPVKAGKETQGYLAVIAQTAEIAEIDRLAVRVGSMALAVELSRRQAVKEIEGRFEEDIVEVLISADQSPQVIRDKARKLKIDLDVPYMAIVIKSAESITKESALMAGLNEMINALIYTHEEELVVLYPVKTGKNALDLKQECKKLLDKLPPSGKTGITAGIGRPYTGPEGIRLSYQEAAGALNMGLKLFGSGSVTGFAELGIYRLLFALKSAEELKKYHAEYLGKLNEYEDKHGGDLSETLRAYLRHSTVADTARDIHVHRNTLLYRLERIQEITGFDLEDGETRLALHLALLADEVLHVS